MDAEACNNEYHRKLKATVPGVFPIANTVHRLRAVYAAYVYHLYSSEKTFNAAAMRFLMHEKLEVSLAYNTVKLHDFGVPEGCYGPLP